MTARSEIQLELTREKLAQAKLQLEKARIRREKAKVQIANTENERQRLQEAYEEQLISEREYDQVRYQLDELGHDERVSASETRELFHRVQELEAEIRKSELEISHTRITAPFGGRITERTMELGKNVRSADKLVQAGSLFSSVCRCLPFGTGGPPGARPDRRPRCAWARMKPLRCVGRVVRVSPVVDTSSGTVKITVELTPETEGFTAGRICQGVHSDRRAARCHPGSQAGRDGTGRGDLRLSGRQWRGAAGARATGL